MGIEEGDTFVGIDVSKARLDVHRLPDRATEAFDYTMRLGLGLTRFGGHPEAFSRGALHGQNPTTLFA